MLHTMLTTSIPYITAHNNNVYRGVDATRVCPLSTDGYNGNETVSCFASTTEN